MLINMDDMSELPRVVESGIRNKDCVITERGGIVENRHKVHVAVIDSKGKLLYTVGDPSRLTLARSAAKPVQALAILETGCFDRYGFDDADLALMCASHNSEERHISRARTMLAKIGVGEDALRCGGHSALSETVNHSWIRRGYIPTAVDNNCSGKHSGMLAGATTIGAQLDDYHLITHPMQLRVKCVTEELCGRHASMLRWGIDGCNLPAPALPLHSLGQIYATVAEAADGLETGTVVTTRSQALSRIFHAMAQHPELVGGDGRFCTVLMKCFQGELVGKVGADGCYGVGIRASEQTKLLGADGAIGISVKIEDGNIGMLYSVVVEVLEQLRIGTAETRKELANFHNPRLLNTAGVITGRVFHSFRLRDI